MLREKCFKTSDKCKRCVLYVVLAIIPIIGAWVLLLKYNIHVSALSIFNSQWNDELSYYKQIEGIMRYGMPQGYFGYNESKAMIGTYGPWSPVLLIPYAIIFRIIGLGTYKILLVNLVLCSLTLIGITHLLELNWMPAISIAGLFAANANIIRYTMSISPEIIIMLGTLWMICFLYKYENSSDDKYYWAYIAIMTYLSLSRGYYVIFGVAGIFIAKRKRVKLITALIAICTAIAYLLIIHFFCSPYFRSLVNTDLMKLLFTSPKLFVKESSDIIIDGFSKTFKSILEIKNRDAFGGVYYFFSYVVIILLMFGGILKKCKTAILGALSFLFIILSIWLLYDVDTGTRHLMGGALGLISVFLIILSFGNIQRGIVTIAIWGTVALLTFYCETDFVIKPPIVDEKLEREIDKADIQLAYSDNRWDNTVIWSIDCDYRYLYCLPKGVGINLCTNEYVMKNDVNSKYVTINNDNDDLVTYVCDKGWKLIKRIGGISLYATR